MKSIDVKGIIILLLFCPLAEDYEPIRNFYAMIVKKYSEQIVFKKKN